MCLICLLAYELRQATKIPLVDFTAWDSCTPSKRAGTPLRSSPGRCQDVATPQLVPSMASLISPWLMGITLGASTANMSVPRRTHRRAPLNTRMRSGCWRKPTLGGSSMPTARRSSTSADLRAAELYPRVDKQLNWRGLREPKTKNSYRRVPLAPPGGDGTQGAVEASDGGAAEGGNVAPSTCGVPSRPSRYGHGVRNAAGPVGTDRRPYWLKEFGPLGGR